jgi:SAM-dependent methyltransferase
MVAIDFHAEANRETYASREAAGDWSRMIASVVDPHGLAIVDIGCGGGIYSREWARLGAASVTGVDFSDQMIAAAVERSAAFDNLSFRKGEAISTGLADGCADVVFERALIHHLKDLHGCFAEARRLLRPGGLLIIQDRTPEDVALRASADHIRGYIFARFPRLLAVENARRPTGEVVTAGMRGASFKRIKAESFWEVRAAHPDFEVFADDMRARTGRSILHELDDGEIDKLIAHIHAALPEGRPVIERDRWTIWHGRR